MHKEFRLAGYSGLIRSSAAPAKFETLLPAAGIRCVKILFIFSALESYRNNNSRCDYNQSAGSHNVGESFVGAGGFRSMGGGGALAGDDVF